MNPHSAAHHPPCFYCHQPCQTIVNRRRAHRTCNNEYIEQHRSNPSHRKRVRRDDTFSASPVHLQSTSLLSQYMTEDEEKCATTSSTSATTSSLNQLEQTEFDAQSMEVGEKRRVKQRMLASSAFSSSSTLFSSTASSASASPATEPISDRILPLHPSSQPLRDLSPAITWKHYGYARIPASNETSELATEMLEMERPTKLKQKEQIAGAVMQYDLSNHKPFTGSPLSTKWRSCVLNSVKDLFGMALFTIFALLHLISPKLLVAQPGEGLQTVHWDHIEGDESPEDNITVILYCADTKSTAMPRFPKGTIRTGSVKEKQASCQYLKPEWYHSVDVKAGDILIFRQRTPHFGVMNESATSERVAFFSMLSKELNPKQDQYQLFRWKFIEEAFGTDSKRYAEVLVDERLQHPLGRFDKTALKDAEKCLKTYELMDDYYGRDGHIHIHQDTKGKKRKTT